MWGAITGQDWRNAQKNPQVVLKRGSPEAVLVWFDDTN
jgi:hypothetical protein